MKLLSLPLLTCLLILIARASADTGAPPTPPATTKPEKPTASGDSSPAADPDASDADSKPEVDEIIVMRFPLRYAQTGDQKILQTADGTKSITIPGVMGLLASMITQPSASSSDSSSSSSKSADKTGSSSDGPPVLNLVSPVADATQAVATAVQNIADAEKSLAASANGQLLLAKGKSTSDNSRGTGIPNFVADPGSNTVIIWDKQSHYSFYEGLIKQLDRPRELIEISVAVIDIDATVNLEWGSEIQFAANGTVNGHPASARASSSFPYSPAVTTSSAGGLPNATDSLNTAAGQTTPFGFSPATVEGAPFSIAGVIASTSTRLVSRIRMLENENKAHILSRPSILTLANIPASFSDTSMLYVPVVGNNFTNFFEVPITTSINVLPRVVASGEPGHRLIHLVVSADDSTSVANAPQANNNPVIQTASVSTQAVISENGSLLLAGTYRHEQELQESHAPILGSIPVLGLPFKQKSVTNQRVQRYFLISPRIVQAGPNPTPHDSEIWNTNPRLVQAAALLANAPVPKAAAVVDGGAAQLRRQTKAGSFPDLEQPPAPLTASAPSPNPITGDPTPSPPDPAAATPVPTKKKPTFMSRVKHLFSGKTPPVADDPRTNPAVKTNP